MELYTAEFGNPSDHSVSVKKSQKGNFVVTSYYEPNEFKSVLWHKVTYNSEGQKINIEGKH